MELFNNFFILLSVNLAEQKSKFDVIDLFAGILFRIVPYTDI